MQTWLDLSDSAGGLAIANQTAGGAHILDGVVGLTLLRSPIYAHHAPHVPENSLHICDHTDQGVHDFEFLMIPHSSSWQSACIPQQALLLNRPPVKVMETFHSGPLPQHLSAIHIDAPQILLSCWKPAYDGNGTVLRLWESSGAAADATITLPLLGLRFPASFTPYEVKTFRIDRANQVTPCTLTEFPVVPAEIR